MSKTIRGVLAFLALCGLSLFLLNCGSTVSRTSGLLYVLVQGSNQVSSYALDLNSGNLSLINSNATTGSMPSNILLDPSGKAAFVLNTGSSDITAYTINGDGSLSKASAPPPPVPQSAVAMVRDAAGKFLFVVSQGAVPPPANCPADPACPQIAVFAMQSGSTSLSAVGSTGLNRIPTAVTAATANSNTILYVTGNQDLSGRHNDNTLSEYSVDASGNLTEHDDPNTGLPYTTAINPSAALAVTTSPIGGTGGVFVYVASAVNNSVSIFQPCVVQNANCSQTDVNNLKLLPVGTPVTVGSNPVAMTVDPKNNFLFVVCENSSQIFGYRINATQGTLTALSPSNLNTGSEPVALAMHPSGRFLYVSNRMSANISSYTVDTTSGAMNSLQTITTSNANPAGLVSK